MSLGASLPPGPCEPRGRLQSMKDRPRSVLRRMKPSLSCLLARLLTVALLPSSGVAQSTWHLRYTAPERFLEPGHGLLGITYADGHYVAVGFRQTVLTSTNAVTWTSRMPESDTTLTDVLHARGRFLAVGYRRLNEPNPWGDWSYVPVLLESTNGLDWTAQDSSGAFFPARLLEWSDMVVSLGHVQDEGSWVLALATSTDGRSWSERWRSPRSGWFHPEPGARDGVHWVLIANEAAILAGPMDDGTFVRSTSGTDWQQREEKGQRPFLATDGRRFLKVIFTQDSAQAADPGTWETLASDDGLTWAPVGVLGKLSSPVEVQAFGYGGGEFLLLAQRNWDESVPSAFRSKDGRDWTETPMTGMRPGGIGTHWPHTVSSLIHADGTWLAIGQPQVGQAGVNNHARLFSSPDGVHWTSRIWETDDGPLWMAQDDSGLVARRANWDPAGGQSSPWIVRSADGVAWSEPVFDPTLWSPPPRGAPTEATDGTNRVRIRQGVLEHSVDGVSWEGKPDLGRELAPFSVVYGNGRFLVMDQKAGHQGPSVVFTSPDGRTWTKRWDRPWRSQENTWSPGDLVDLIVANGEFRALALGFLNGEHRLFSSATGDAWTASFVGWDRGTTAHLFVTDQSLFAAGFSHLWQSSWDLKLAASGPDGNGALHLRLFGRIGQQVDVQSADGLDAPAWQTVQTIALATSPTSVIVPLDTRNPRRFLRARAR